MLAAGSQGCYLRGLPERASAQVITILIALATFLSLLVAAIFLGEGVFNVTDHLSVLPYVGLFVTSLIAGTLLPFVPGSSEMAMAGLLATGAGVPVLLIAAAITGNVIGATANYLVGWNIGR